MENLPQHYVYQQDVIEFVTAGVQTCLILEHVGETDKKEFINNLLNILPILYVRARSLQLPQPLTDGFPQQFVTEEYYNYVAEGVKQMLGSDDAYLEVFMEDMRYSDEPIAAFLSENLADIYQELKNLAFNYQQQDEMVMNDSLLACLEGFREHWAQKLLNALRALNSLYFEIQNNVEEE